jgi:hypothetical protein
LLSFSCNSGELRVLTDILFIIIRKEKAAGNEKTEKIDEKHQEHHLQRFFPSLHTIIIVAVIIIILSSLSIIPCLSLSLVVWRRSALFPTCNYHQSTSSLNSLSWEKRKRRQIWERNCCLSFIRTTLPELAFDELISWRENLSWCPSDVARRMEVGGGK